MHKYIGLRIFELQGLSYGFPNERVTIIKGYVEKVENIPSHTEYIVDGECFTARAFYPMLIGDDITHRKKVLMHNLFRHAIRTDDRCLINDLHKWADLACLAFVSAPKEDWTKSGLKGLYN